jgi:hypothetical protein
VEKEAIRAILDANPEIDAKRVRRVISSWKKLRQTGVLKGRRRGYNLAPPFSRGAVPEDERAERRLGRLRHER